MSKRLINDFISSFTNKLNIPYLIYLMMNCKFIEPKTNIQKDYLCLEPKITESQNLIITKTINIKYRLWSFRYEFLKYYKAYISRVKTFINNKIRICPFCEYEDKEHKIFYDSNNKLCWGSLTYHLMKEHNYEPKNLFIRYILSLSNNKFFKIGVNDMILFDGLMNAGGRFQRFKYNQKIKMNNADEVKKNRIYLYSEYSGYLDIKCKNKICKIDNIEISNFRRTEPDIYMVNFFFDKLKDKRYIFHTHPPTPKAGSRIATDRIVYEFPSFDDINSFIEMKQKFEIDGELIFTPEGIYVLMVYDIKKKIENQKFKEKNKFIQILNEAYYEYKNVKDENEFYSTVAQNYIYIKKVNTLLKKYNLIVQYFPKEQLNGEWIYGKIYLPFKN